jgi:hypothetical protein
MSATEIGEPGQLLVSRSVYSAVASYSHILSIIARPSTERPPARGGGQLFGRSSGGAGLRH